jgi:hypothetical protein
MCVSLGFIPGNTYPWIISSLFLDTFDWQLLNRLGFQPPPTFFRPIFFCGISIVINEYLESLVGYFMPIDPVSRRYKYFMVRLFTF